MIRHSWGIWLTPFSVFKSLRPKYQRIKGEGGKAERGKEDSTVCALIVLGRHAGLLFSRRKIKFKMKAEPKTCPRSHGQKGLAHFSSFLLQSLLGNNVFSIVQCQALCQTTKMAAKGQEKKGHIMALVSEWCLCSDWTKQLRRKGASTSQTREEVWDMNVLRSHGLMDLMGLSEKLLGGFLLFLLSLAALQIFFHLNWALCKHACS